MDIYLLEIYENSKTDIPDFGLSFNTMDLLIEFVEKKIKKLTPENIAFAHELTVSGLSLSLDPEETIRVTLIPLVEHIDDKRYNNLMNTTSKIKIKESANIIEVPEGSENSITLNSLKTGNTIIDFHGIKNHNPPLYVRNTTFEKLEEPKRDPWSLMPLKNATSYKIRTVPKKNTLKTNRKNNNNKNNNNNNNNNQNQNGHN